MSEISRTDPSIDVHTRVLAGERLRSARRIAGLRIVLVTAFYVRAIAMAWGFGGPWGPQRTLMTAYLLIAVGIWVAAVRSERWATASSLALTVVDLPMAFLLTWPPLADAAATRAVASLSAVTGAYLVVVLLTVLTIRRWQVVGTGALAIAFQIAVAAELGTPMNEATYAVALTLSTVGLGLYLVHRLGALVRSTAVEQTIRHRLDRHFSPEVAALLERWPGGGVSETRTITVLFSDLRGFTALSQTLSSVAVVDLLNEVHSRLAGCVFDHGGTLDKFMGDGMLAYFNAPLDQPDHARRAWLCADAMVREIEGLNEERAKRALSPLGLSVGIHTGEATVGILGPDTRHEYTAVGETVNIAAHVEKLTRTTGDTVLLTEATRRALGTATPMARLPGTPIPGVDRPIALYRLEGAPGLVPGVESAAPA